MESYLFGILSAVPWWTTALGTLLLVLALGYLGAPLPFWVAGATLLSWGAGAPPWVWVLLGLVALLFLVPPLRRLLVSGPLLKGAGALGMLPSISETERIALEAGDTWIEGDVFAGHLDFQRLLEEDYPELTEEEAAFLDGPVEQLCAMVDEWDVNENEDLPAEAWAYIKEHRFLGLVIPEDYGGRGFSATAMNAVTAKLGSRSVALAVDVMVPNSLGPGELLIDYGTEEQRERWLPALARGEEIPSFALTEPGAGSDASGLTSHGEVVRGQDGELYVRLDWSKRYITLAPIATLLGLAFRLSDPDDLRGQGTEPGITLALVPTDLEGVEASRRHDPLSTPFLNGPTRGEGVMLPVDHIIGGPEQAGNGWRMLMETLGRGRGIFLPALNGGGGKYCSRVAGEYAAVRQQFGPAHVLGGAVQRFPGEGE